uniref:non-specific serine/threonine protein kinase n=1 Tax=Solibacter usitatus (strain Ellin6076) TaxID=234267 RepID=Q02DC3_SOLUE
MDAPLQSRYRLAEKLGEGGLGAVYRARDIRLGRDVALKFLQPALAQDEGRRERFLNEARAAAALNHPGIATIHSIEEDDGSLFIVMELIEGQTLRQLSGGRPMPLARALQYCTAAADALRAAHHKGIIHRDIKSSNIMVTAEDRVKVLDFGLAKLPESSLVTQENILMGTMAYMSPEQAIGAAVDPRCDLWSLGIVLYELLTGRLPFTGENYRAVLHGLLNTEPEPVSRYRGDVPATVHRILARALTKDRELRYASADLMLSDLRNWHVMRPSSDATETLVETPTQGGPPSSHSTGIRSTLLQSSLGTTERRQITFLYCELDYPASAAADPEEFMAAVAECKELCERIIVGFDGKLSPWMGDAAIAYFGYPLAQEDAPLRAACAGLGIVEALRRQSGGHEGKAAPGVRLGIDTSLAVAATNKMASAETGGIVSEGATLARGLAQVAETNTLLVSPDAHRLVASHFQFRDAGEQRVRGFHRPVRLYEVLRRSEARNRLESGAALTPLAGREQELSFLLARWNRAVAGSGQVVLLGGSAGIGKSRLSYELKHHAAQNPAAWLIECFCSPFHSSSALYPIVDFLERAILDPERNASAEQKLKHLEGMLAEYALDLKTHVPLLAPLFAIPYGEPYQTLELTPEKQRTMAMESLLSLLLERAYRQPVLFVLEDVHWADPSTLELMGMLVDQVPSVAVMALMTHRPEFTLPWPGRGHVAALPLDRLSHEHALEIAQATAKSAGISTSVLEQIVKNSDGVPLFLEELTLSVVEAGPGSKSTIPTTLRDSFMSRLDRLGEARPVAQMAAVLGREFPYKLLLAVAGYPEAQLKESLKRLVEAEVLYPRGVQDRLSYIFKHALLQEAAYEALLKRDRAALHMAIGQLLVEQFAELLERQPELAAHHFTEGGMGGQAIQYWHKAGMKALERSAYVEAITHFSRALQIFGELPAEQRRPEQELLLVTSIGMPQIATMGFGAAAVGKTYQRAQELTETVGDGPLLLPALFGASVYRLVRAELSAASAIAGRMTAVGEREENLGLRLEGYWALGDAQFWQGNLAEAGANVQKTLDLYDAVRDRMHAYWFGQDPAVAALCYLCFVQWFAGYPDQAMATAARAEELARRIRHPFSIGWSLAFPAALAYFARRPQEAVERAETGIRYCTEQAYPFWTTCNVVVKGWGLCLLGRAEEGVALMRGGIAGMEMIGSIVVQPLYYGAMAEGLLAAGQTDDAVHAAATGLMVAQHHGVRISEIDLHRIQGDLMLATAPARREEAELSYRRAMALARECGARFFELRAAAALCRSMGERGAGDEGRRMLRAIHAQMTEGFQLADLQGVQEMLTN